MSASPEHRGIRGLLFLGFAAATAAIVIGFFVMEWQTQTERSGSQFINLAVQDFDNLLQQATGRELSPALIQDFMDGFDERTRTIVENRWTAVAIYYVLLLAISYAFSTLGAFVMTLLGRPIMPLNAVGKFFALIGMIFTILLNLLLPLFIMWQFHEQFLAPANVDVGTGFWVTLGGVVVGAATVLMGDMTRFFADTAAAPAPQPAASGARFARGGEQRQRTYDPYGTSYYDDDDDFDD